MENRRNEIKPVLLNNTQLTIDKFRELFKIEFRNYHNREFEITDNSISLLDTLINYFYKNDDFYNSNCLIKNLNKPSLEKGLLIIGNSGIGKSGLLEIFFNIFTKHCHFDPKFRFRLKSAIKIVSEYESKEKFINNDDFFNKYSKGFLMIDDIKSESEASNYGKKNLLKDILFLRNENKARTILTCNFSEEFPNDIEAAITEFGLKYDHRIYDRIFEMCNIIEGKGKSFRN